MLRRFLIGSLGGAYAIFRGDIRGELNGGSFSVRLRSASRPTMRLGTLLVVGETV